MYLFISFLIGACIGSFLNVFVDRLSINENPFAGRSHCDHCKKTLSVPDLIPILSFIFFRGRCRYCKKKLSLYYPLTEFLTGLVFTITFSIILQSHPIGSMPLINFITLSVLYFLIVSFSIVIFFSDIKFGIIPFWAVASGSIIALVLHYNLANAESILPYFLSGIVTFLLFLILFFITNMITRGKGMGFGDVAYVFFMGFLLGFPNIILGLYIAFISGAIISLSLVILKKKKLHGSTIPFGPFLVSGSLISFFWGDTIIRLMTSYLLRY